METKINISDPVLGFTERDFQSKAILNTDADALLKYKIQRRKMIDINKNRDEMLMIKSQVSELKNDICEIKSLLLSLTSRR